MLHNPPMISPARNIFIIERIKSYLKRRLFGGRSCTMIDEVHNKTKEKLCIKVTSKVKLLSLTRLASSYIFDSYNFPM